MVKVKSSDNPRINTKAKYFYRYTNLAAAIHLLKNRKITLLDPMEWDDKNDVFFMSRYKEQRNAKTVLALCFVEGTESYHHWKVFSSGPNGISINFEKDKLLSIFEKEHNIRHGRVKYFQIQKIEKLLKTSTMDITKLPFLKRYPYRGEKEYRIIYADTERRIYAKDYDIDLSWIKWIRLSPWIPKQLAKSVVDSLKSISQCQNLEIIRSTLIDSERWKNIADNSTIR